MIASTRVIPTTAPATSVSFTVLSNGNDLGPALPVLSIVIDREINRIPTATLILQDGSLADQTFPLSESGQFDPGTEIEISLGYQGTNESVFKGIVTGQRIQLNGGKTLLVINCKDAAFKMTINRASRFFEEQSDADAWNSLINEAGLEADVSGATEITPDLAQHLSTDWDFIISRVEAKGLVASVEDGKITIKKPELATTPSLKLEYGANLIDFEAEIDARYQFNEVKSYAWRAPEDETVDETNPPSAPGFSTEYPTDQLAEVHGQQPYKQVQGGGVQVQELIDWSAATARFSSLSRLRGTASFQGSSVLQVGDTIELDKLGAVYNGPAYVSGLRHELSAGRWTTTVQLGLQPERFTERYAVNAPPAGGLLPATSGLHIGTVVQMHDDPAGEERIQITLPATAPEGAGNWARLATGLAGNEAGLTFRPAVGDEVVVGFLHDDPRFPIILGCLHASGRPAPYPPTEDNDQTGYQSRGGHQLLFNDTEESILLENPSGDKLELLGKDGTIKLEDQNGNKIEMTSSGILIETQGDLELKATGSIKVDGTQVEINSSATGKFEAGATLTLKGAMVQIN
ncbi:MAG: type VI secretion system tip protein VgrG [Bacteroidota bacterium]